MENETNSTSKFNDAVLQIMRLNNMWLNCKHYRTKGNLEAWRWELDGVWTELYSDAIKKEGKDLTKNDYYLKINVLDKLINTSKTNRHLLYKYLDLKEKLLRTLQDEAGKGSKYENDEEDLF